MQPTTDKIFVSYSRHDEAFARKLAIWLSKTLNLGVWIDIDDIPPGVKWSAAIQDGLDNCEVMVVIVTPESMESINVEDEWQYFIDLGKPVVPILLRSAPIPYQLRRIQWVDFSDKTEYNNSLRQLIVELRQHLKPLDHETVAPTARSRQPQTSTVVESKKSKKSRQRIKQAESLIEQQSQAIQRSNRLVTALIVLLIVVGLGASGLFAWLYFNQPTRFFLQGNRTGGFAILPGETEVVALATLGDTVPVGTRIQAGAEPLTLYSEGGAIQTVLQADSTVSVNDLTNENLDLTVTTGNVSAATNGAQGRVALTNGVTIETRNNVEVEVDNNTDEVVSNCFSGCTVTDTRNGETVSVEEGQSITFSVTDPNILDAIIRSIPGEIAYVTNRHGAAEIYLMTPDGQTQIRLTNNVRIEDESPSWSPDGRLIAYVTDISGNFDIWSVDPLMETDPVNLTNDRNQDRSPAWSPDGTRIAFVSNRSRGIDDIYVMNADGSDVIQITTTGGNESPTWSPDGSRIAFSSRRSGNDEVYILDVTEPNAEAINITNNEASDTDPAWSPDGSRIAFVSNRDNNLEVYVQDLATEDSEPINVSLDTGRDFEPAWSPDSGRLIFTSERFGDLDIVLVSANLAVGATEPNGLLRLTDESSESDQEATWLPIVRAGR